MKVLIWPLRIYWIRLDHRTPRTNLKYKFLHSVNIQLIHCPDGSIRLEENKKNTFFFPLGHIIMTDGLVYFTSSVAPSPHFINYG